MNEAKLICFAFHTDKKCKTKWRMLDGIFRFVAFFFEIHHCFLCLALLPKKTCTFSQADECAWCDQLAFSVT